MPQSFWSISALGGSGASPNPNTINKNVANTSKTDVSVSQTEISVIAEEDSDNEVDQISKRLCELQEDLLTSLKDDISDWINKTLGDTSVNAENFIYALDTGIILCRVSMAIEKKAQECAQNGTLKEPLPNYRLRYNEKANSGTWFARDNTANFLKWCRAYGMTDETLFDSEDLVTHHHERQVIYCLMELARMGARFGLEPSSLITMEKEIDSEMVPPSPHMLGSPAMQSENDVKEELSDHTAPPTPPKSPSTPPKSPSTPPKFPPLIRNRVLYPLIEEDHDLDTEVYKISIKCQCEGHVNKLSEGVFNVYGKRVFIRLLKGKHLMVRVGGGWDTFENYLLHHDPVQVFRFSHGNQNGHLQKHTHSECSVNQFAVKDYLVIRSKYKSSSFCSSDTRSINI